MAQLANINIKNAAAVEQVYVATPGENPGTSYWFNGTGAWAARFKAWLTYKLAAANSVKGQTLVTLGHSVPFFNATTGVLDYVVQYKLQVTLPVQCTQAERDEAYARFVDLLADPVSSAALKSYEFPS